MNAAEREMDQADRASRAATSRVAALRAERTAALAKRGATAREAARDAAYLVCACGTERFGLPLGAVARVLAARTPTPVPGAPPAILGLVALSGRIVSVVGRARALGRPGAEGVAGGHLVVLRASGTPTALAVDRVLGLAHLDAADAPGDGFGSDAVSRYAPADPGPSGLGDFVVIDLPQLLRRILP